MSTHDAFGELIASFLPGDVVLAALVNAYFDESGTHDGSPVMTVSGYLFKPDQAQKFSRDWSRFLAGKGLPFAHQTDCALGHGYYKDMTKGERVAIQKELILRIKQRSIIGVGASVDPTYFANQCAQIGSVVSAYTFAIFGCLVNIERWAQRTGFGGRIAYFFESGHAKQSEANAILTDLSKRPEGDQFRYFSHTFMDKKDAPPLQAADMLAWQSRKFAVDQIAGKNGPRKDFRALIRPQDTAIDYTRANVSELVDIMARKAIERGPSPGSGRP